MNYSSPVHEHFLNGLKVSWYHELHFAGVSFKQISGNILCSTDKLVLGRWTWKRFTEGIRSAGSGYGMLVWYTEQLLESGFYHQ